MRDHKLKLVFYKYSFDGIVNYLIDDFFPTFVSYLKHCTFWPHSSEHPTLTQTKNNLQSPNNSNPTRMIPIPAIIYVGQIVFVYGVDGCICADVCDTITWPNRARGRRTSYSVLSIIRVNHAPGCVRELIAYLLSSIMSTNVLLDNWTDGGLLAVYKRNVATTPLTDKLITRDFDELPQYGWLFD